MTAPSKFSITVVHPPHIANDPRMKMFSLFSPRGDMIFTSVFEEIIRYSLIGWLNETNQTREKRLLDWSTKRSNRSVVSTSECPSPETSNTFPGSNFIRVDIARDYLNEKSGREDFFFFLKDNWRGRGWQSCLVAKRDEKQTTNRNPWRASRQICA